MSNFCAEADKQKKLTVVRSKPAESVKNQTLSSFFEMLPQEKTGSLEKEPATLGLLAYMSEEDRQSYKTNWDGASNGITSHQGIEKYTTTCRSRSVWDELDRLPPEKVPKPGTKGAVTLYSLLDTDSSTTSDPWKELELPHSNIPLSSTPHHKVSVPQEGPLDAFRQSDHVDPWSHHSNRNSSGKMESRVSKTKSRRKRLITEAKNSRPVNSYFSNTRSVWTDLQPSDEDIICLSENAESVTSSSENRKGGKPQKKRGRPGKIPAKTVKTPSSTPFTLRNKMKSNTHPTPAKQTIVCPDVITLSD